MTANNVHPIPSLDDYERLSPQLQQLRGAAQALSALAAEKSESPAALWFIADGIFNLVREIAIEEAEGAQNGA